MICLIAGVILAFYCENKVISAFTALSEEGPPSDGAWLEIAGMSVRSLSEPSLSHSVTWPFTKFLPYETETAVRGFRANADGFSRETIRSITYVVNVTADGAVYEVGLRIGSFLLYFIFAFTALHVFEIFELFSRTVRDRRLVRRTLDPIAELARTAQTLNEVNRQLDREKTMALAGRLNGFDAGRLDMRIQVDDLQEELKNVAVAINGMLDRINETYASQMRFVSDASHELRTPIAVIQGYANLLDRWGKEDEKALTESVSAIKDEAGNMKDLVEQLLFLARGDSNRIGLSKERIEIFGLVEEVADESRMLDSGHEFKVGGDVATICADRALIKQALRILVDNAIKYTDTGGEISISVGCDGEFARLSVTDNGIGISPNILPYVFDRFVRADESRARATGGAGLGLSIAQWIAMRHNGRIEVLSREQIGTRMTLVFPVAAAGAQG
ncbi:MAG: HAMP domain-containing histidine kinase [Oscillospiraceae bacterium]|jgi:signal transduction histidine kinase|nr:HAMP domain-containing histidine kinase [Oscillospiraceae bacterium]